MTRRQKCSPHKKINMKTNIIRLRETDSTNKFLSQYTDCTDSDLVVVTAEYQTNGRGQGTNTWESENSQNLLFSMLTKPTGVDADKQFVLSMAEALALREALGACVSDITLKWPNDVYWRDYKISGTLIETALSGKKVKQCIFGTGINVNQTLFLSSAPNPTSLCLITGRTFSKDEVLDKVLKAFERYYQMVLDGRYDTISEIYHNALYRREGLHTYSDKNGTFEASIKNVALNGTLTLVTKEGEERKYMFKEVNYVL